MRASPSAARLRELQAQLGSTWRRATLGIINACELHSRRAGEGRYALIRRSLPFVLAGVFNLMAGGSIDDADLLISVSQSHQLRPGALNLAVACCL